MSAAGRHRLSFRSTVRLGVHAPLSIFMKGLNAKTSAPAQPNLQEVQP